MPISYSVNTSSRTVWAAFFDAVTFEDVASFTSGVLASPASAHSFRQVLDLRDLRAPMDLGAVCELARLVAAAQPARYAVLARTDVQIDAAHALQEMMSGDWCESEIALFHDLASAQAWLGLNKNSAGSAA
jgi:hypothetical protein